jgi:hypothetical protein
MKHEPADWTVDVHTRQALHVSGLLIRAERNGDEWRVQPMPETLPPHGPPMPAAAAEAAKAWIGHLVATGGDLLVKAVAKHLSTH